MCGIVVEHDGQRVSTIRGDRDDAFSRGHICPKAMGLKDVHEDPDRLKLPQRRVGERWETISWDEAFAEAAGRLHAIQRAHGKHAVALYQGNPTVHNYGSMLFGQIFARTLGTRSRFSATSVDQLPHHLAAYAMFGHQLLLPVPDVDRTDHLLILGANPVASNGSLMTAPGIAKRLEAIKERGGKVVVVDPRRTETAELATRHHFIRPGTDALLLFALLHVIFAEKLDRPGRLLAFTDRLDEVRAAAAPFSPSAVAAATGIAAPEIEALARELAAANRAAVYGRMGVCTQEFGGLGAWLCYVLDLVTGNLDREGGAMFTTPAVDAVAGTAAIGMRGHFDKGRTRVRGLPEFGGEYPVSALAEEIETPGPGQLRALVTSAGNPVLSTPNGARLSRALAGLDFHVAIDIYRNETTRHAHLILPPTFGLEHDNYDLAFHLLAVRDTAKYSPALFPPAPDARHDWQIFLELSTRLAAHRGARDGLVARASAAVLGRLGPRGLLDGFLRVGPHRLSVKKLEAAPHGIDLGPLRPMLPDRLHTKNGRIDAAPARILADVPRLAAVLSREEQGLSLIGRRDLRTNNSWLHNSLRLVKGPNRCTLLMHPLDASARGLSDGASVRVASRVGEVVTSLTVTDAVMPGVVSLPHGWGHDRPGAQLSVASAHAGVSLNDVTDEKRVDALSGNAVLNGVPVEVGAA